MNSATFLLAFNFAIGLSFAVAFLALTWRTGVRLGRWCAVGFILAAATVSVEALASVIPSARLTSTLSFSTLMLALTLIAIGLDVHYRGNSPQTPFFGWLFALCGVSIAFKMWVGLDLRRGSWEQALAYQAPFATMTALAACIVVLRSRRRTADLILAAILTLCFAHFMAKIVFAGLAGDGPDVRGYIFSEYAFYSQTIAGVLSLLLGLSLVGVVLIEVLEESKRQFQRDMLSGVLNRSAFVDYVGTALRQSSAASSSLIICDLDHFKSINDRFGHAAGDEVIRAFGTNFLAHFGDAAICGRLGGEEFCIFLPEGEPDKISTHLEALRLRARQNHYALVPPNIAVTASFGVAVLERTEPFDQALRRADMALYEAKAAGRNCYRFAASPAQEGDYLKRGGAFRIGQVRV